MELQNFIDEMRPAVERSLQSLIEVSIPEQYAEMKQILRYQLGWEGEDAGIEAQGKRIRPLLLLLSAAAAGGIWEDAVPAAASVELLHNFSLIHDDIQDKSRLRRGRPTIWVQWGEALAINGGDLMFTLSQLAVLDLSKALERDVVLKAAVILNRTCVQLTGGQHLDISYEKSRVLPLEFYWPMVNGKTAALIECCCEIGAVTANADIHVIKAFSEFGRSLGLAFQVLDDYLGIWGDVELTGKSTESDLVSGKKSLPVLFGLHQGGKFYRRWMKGRIFHSEITELSAVLKEEGAQEYTLQAANQLTEHALEALGRATGKKNDACAALVELANELIARNK